MRTSRLSRRVSICSWLAIAHQPSSRRYRGLNYEVKERSTETGILNQQFGLAIRITALGKNLTPGPSPTHSTGSGHVSERGSKRLRRGRSRSFRCAGEEGLVVFLYVVQR